MVQRSRSNFTSPGARWRAGVLVATALVGVTMMWEILCLLSEAVARRKGRI